MKPQIKVLITFAILIGLVGLFYFTSQEITRITGKSIFGWIIKEKPVGSMEEFAQCLSDKGAKMYGAYWCGHCQSQKKLFDYDGGNYLIDRGVYVECDPRGENSQTDLCLTKGIQGYPTWEINEKMYTGEQSIDKLAELAGCNLPK